MVFVFDAGFCFLDPCTCFVDLASTGAVGRTPMLCAHIGPDVFWTLAFFFGPVHVLWTLHRAGGISKLRQCACKKLVMQGKRAS